MVTALLVGLVVGFVLAIPPGPIAVACLQHALAGRVRAGVHLALGAAAMDIVYASMAAWASSALFLALGDLVTAHPWVLLVVQVGGIVVLVGLGLRYVRATPPADTPGAGPAARTRGTASPVLMGVLLALTNLANPTFLPSLLFVMSVMHGRGWVGHAVGENVLYALGFGAGAACWFVLLLRGLTTLRAKLPPHVLPLLSRVAGCLLLLCAVILASTLVTTTWSRLGGW